MKNELGNVPKESLDEEIAFDDKLPKKEVKEIKKNKEVKTLDDPDKLNKALTIVLVSAITIVILILLGFGVKKLFDIAQAKKENEEKDKWVQGGQIQEGPGQTEVYDEHGNPILTEDTGIYDGTQIRTKRYYKGFEIVGEIKIPKTKLTEYIVKPMTNKSLEVAVAVEYTINGLNKVGNTTISGHNYKNEKFFSNNYKIEIGDAIYIKDETGQELKYDVYDIQELGETDKSFIQRNTNGAIEVTLLTCTDNVVNRIVVFAKHNPQPIIEE